MTFEEWYGTDNEDLGKVCHAVAKAAWHERDAEIARLRDDVRQLAERLAICSELLGKAAERRIYDVR